MTNSYEPLPAPSLAEASFSNSKTAISVLTDQALYDACGLRIAFTTRGGGVSEPPYDSLNLGDHVEDDLDDVTENRRLLMESMGVPQDRQRWIVAPKQVHGDLVLTVGENVAGVRAAAHCGADGIICPVPQVPVLLCFADCVPVIVAAPNGDFAVLHAGWRGALAGIPGKGLALLARKAQCDPAECNAYIGPHIGACCYEVSQEILDQFTAKYGGTCDAGNRHLDLTAAVGTSLIQAGADVGCILDAKACTCCNSKTYYSYRAEGGVTGRHGAFAYKEVI